MAKLMKKIVQYEVFRNAKPEWMEMTERAKTNWGNSKTGRTREIERPYTDKEFKDWADGAYYGSGENGWTLVLETSSYRQWGHQDISRYVEKDGQIYHISDGTCSCNMPWENSHPDYFEEVSKEEFDKIVKKQIERLGNYSKKTIYEECFPDNFVMTNVEEIIEVLKMNKVWELCERESQKTTTFRLK